MAALLQLRGCRCRLLVKAERRADLRERRKASITVRGRLIGISSFEKAVAVAQELAKELERERGTRIAAHLPRVKASKK